MNKLKSLILKNKKKVLYCKLLHNNKILQDCCYLDLTFVPGGREAAGSRLFSELNVPFFCLGIKNQIK